MDEQQKLFGLMALAEEQQKAVQAAIEGLKGQQSAMLQAVQTGTAQAVNEAARPLIGELSGVVQAASQAEGKLSGAVTAFGWRWALLVGCLGSGAIVALLVSAWLAVWWQRYQVEDLAEQKAALLEEVGELRANAEDWAKRGGRAKLETCGDAGRLCVRVDKSIGYGEGGDYFVLRGY